MRKIFRAYNFFWLALMLTAFQFVYAQNDNEVQHRPFDEESWQKATKDLDYSEELEIIEESKKRKKPLFDSDIFQILGGIFNVVAVFIAFLIIAYLLYLVADNYYFEPKRQKNKQNVNIENLEDHIHDIDLDALLLKTLAEENYKLAVRVQYLIVVKQISNLKLIRWKKQKTNGEYLSEMYAHNQFQAFQKATNIYERIWFGEVVMDKQKYELVAPNFTSILQNLKPQTITHVK